VNQSSIVYFTDRYSAGSYPKSLNLEGWKTGSIKYLTRTLKRNVKQPTQDREWRNKLIICNYYCSVYVVNKVFVRVMIRANIIINKPNMFAVDNNTVLSKLSRPHQKSLPTTLFNNMRNVRIQKQFELKRIEKLYVLHTYL